MLAKSQDWASPQFYHQKGWIATKFQVTNHNHGALRWKKRNLTVTHLIDSKSTLNQPPTLHPSIQHQSPHNHDIKKPVSAPSKNRTKIEITQNLQKMGVSNSKWDQSPSLSDSRYCNFRASIGNKKQLLYIKPYTRYQNNSMTIDQKKAQIYRQINSPDVNNCIDSFQNHSKFIQYLTEYQQPFSSRQQADLQKQTYKCRNRSSFNVIKNKLKRRCEPSNYLSKINAIKFQ